MANTDKRTQWVEEQFEQSIVPTMRAPMISPLLEATSVCPPVVGAATVDCGLRMGMTARDLV